MAAATTRQVNGMANRTKLLVMGGVVAVKVAAYLVWRPVMLRWGTQGEEAVEPSRRMYSAPCSSATVIL